MTQFFGSVFWISPQTCAVRVGHTHTALVRVGHTRSLTLLAHALAMSQKRAVAAAYLAEHRLETILSHALNAVVGLSPTDIVLALGISLRRHAQSAQSHAEVESTLHHATLLAVNEVNEAEARAVVAKVAQQLGPREAGQKPSVAELRSLEQTLSGLINDVLYDMPTDPIRSIGSAVGP